MRKAVALFAVIASILCIGTLTNRAAAMMVTPRSEIVPATVLPGLIQPIHDACRCRRAWARRHYWPWGHDGVWDEQLEERWFNPLNHFWGTPEPPLVPADRWARKWHPPFHPIWNRARHRHHWR
jgi:hypothetical protein